MQRAAALALTATLFAAPAGLAKKWEWDIDPAHAQVGFVATHLSIAKVRGQFQEYDAKIILDDEDVSRSAVTITIDAASVSTNNERRDKHLRSDDFFNAAKYPKLKFVSKSVRKRKDGKLVVVGDLTIRDVTKKVVLEMAGPSAEFKDPGGNPHVVFSGGTSIDRFDYGLKWSKAIEKGGSLVVGKEVLIELELELKNKRPYQEKK